jgi:hypothetical protein
MPYPVAMHSSVVALLLQVIAAQQPAPAAPPTYHGRAGAITVPAVRLDTAITVDGVLDEPAWSRATPVTTFTQLDPEEGRPASERTEVRIVYDGEALYVGARMHDSQRPVSRLVRRDSYVLDSDWFSVALDSYHDHLSSFRFSVNPDGVRRDEVFSSSGRTVSTAGTTVVTDRGGIADQSWDPVWDAATSVSDSGWTVELRIPFSQLRFGPAERQTWGLQLERRIARRQEQSLFAFAPKDQAAGVPLYGHLTGLDGVHARQRLEVLPYVSARVRGRPAGARPSGDVPPGATWSWRCWWSWASSSRCCCWCQPATPSPNRRSTWRPVLAWRPHASTSCRPCRPGCRRAGVPPACGPCGRPPR